MKRLKSNKDHTNEDCAQRSFLNINEHCLASSSLSDKKDNIFLIEDDKERAILVGTNSIEDLNELSELLKTAGGIEAGRLVQNISKFDSAYFIGKGKLQELKEEVQNKNANLIIFDNELSGAQVRNIENEIKIKTIDRTQIILDIFAKRASSREGKLQVELAQLKYLLPRLSGHGIEMSRSGAGIGTRGPGEQKLEVDRRKIRERISGLERRIQQIKKHRRIQRKKRSKLYNICIVGYTNSGKSTLLNALSGSNIYVEDELFATLDPTTRKVQISSKEVVITDTVGFIRNLPHDLINAFKSTLEEVTYADLLLHVVDGSIEYDHQIDIVNEVLKDLKAYNKPTILVVNKMDKIENHKVFYFGKGNEDIIHISAKEKKNIDELFKRIGDYARKESEIIELLIPYSETRLVSYLHGHGIIIKEEYREENIYIKGEFSLAVAGKAKEFIIK